MSEWRDFETAPRDGEPFLAWEVVICDEIDEDDSVVARNQRHERAIIVQYVGIFQTFCEQRGNACPSNGRWTKWAPINPPP